MPDIHSQSCSPCVSSTSTSTLEKNSIGPRPLNRMRSSEFYCALKFLKNSGRCTCNTWHMLVEVPLYIYVDEFGSPVGSFRLKREKNKQTNMEKENQAIPF